MRFIVALGHVNEGHVGNGDRSERTIHRKKHTCFGGWGYVMLNPTELSGRAISHDLQLADVRPLLGLVIGLSRLPVSWRWRKTILLVASYLFYAAWNPPFVVLLWLSTGVDWFVARAMHRATRIGRRRALLIVSLCTNLGLLSFFKYGTFLLDSIVRLIGLVGVTYKPAELSIILPVGISFYTFQTLSYTIDVYRGNMRPWKSFLDFALSSPSFRSSSPARSYRASTFLPQCVEERKATSRQFGWGAVMLVIGLFEKVVLSDAVLATGGGSSLRRGHQRRLHRRLARYVGVLGADLLRLCGLLDMCDRCRNDVGLRHPRQFPIPVCGDRLHRLLAALAHLLVIVASRLSVHSTRRQPCRGDSGAGEPDDDHAPGWVVARRVMALRRMGWPSRLCTVVERWLRDRWPEPAPWLRSTAARVAMMALTYVLFCYALVFVRATDFPNAALIISAMSGLSDGDIALGRRHVMSVVLITAGLLVGHWRLRESSLEGLVELPPLQCPGRAGGRHGAYGRSNPR